MHSLQAFLAESKKHIDFQNKTINRYTELIQQNKKYIQDLQPQRQAVLKRIVEVIAPDFSAPQLEKIAILLHKGELATWSKRLEDEIENSKKRVAEINKDPEYIQREILIDSKTGEYILEYNQINTVYEKVDEEFAPYKKYTFEFEDLITDKYDTPEYEHTGILRFFNNEHLDNWRIGDILCETFEVERFSTLRDNYLRIKLQHSELYEAVKHYKTKINYIVNIINEEGELTRMLPQLPNIHKTALAKEVELFLNSTSPDSLNAFFAAFPNLDKLSKIQQGLNYQHQYLVDFQKKLSEERQVIVERLSRLKIERSRYEANTYKYQHKTWTQDKFKKRFNRNTDYINKRFTKYEKTNSVLGGFNNYDIVPITLSTVFWWDVITNNKIDGSFSPGVTDYYETHTHDKDNFVVENEVVHQSRDNS